MKNKLFTGFLFVASLAAGTPAGSVVIDPAALTTSDHYATDESKLHFYYDLYKITNTSTSNLTLMMTMDPGDSLKPFLGYTFKLGVLPSPDWDSGSPAAYDTMETTSDANAGTTISFGIFSPTLNAGASLLLAVSTFDYIEEVGFQLDAYSLTIEGVVIVPPPPCEFDCGPEGRVVVGQDHLLLVEQILPGAVPAPFTPALLCIGLVGLALTRRRATAWQIPLIRFGA